MVDRRNRARDQHSRVQRRVVELASSVHFSPLAKLVDDFLRSTNDPWALNFVDQLTNLFPKDSNRYFFFDRLLIQDVIDTWNSETLKLSSNLIPSYGNRWGYYSVCLPTLSGLYYPFEFILFPRHEHERPTIEQYVWLLHELGHHTFEKYKSPLLAGFIPKLTEILLNLKLSALADSVMARSKAEALINQLSSYWDPSSGAFNWTYELAIDALALWTSGPVYIDAFVYEHGAALNPFQIEQDHPPVELRGSTMLYTAHTLGWNTYCKDLRQLVGQWRIDNLPAEHQNLYLALRNEALMQTASEVALHYCQTTNLPRLQPANLERIAQTVEAPQVLKGVDLIVAAWLQDKQLGEDAYHAWVENIIAALTDDI